MPNAIQSLFIAGPVGKLEGLLNAGRPDAAYAALVCHPHPVHGGTMHTKVVYHAAKALNSFGLPVLRFNFRGTGLSEGKHDQGRGERDDISAALDWLERKYSLPIIFAGFSFGAATGLKTCCPDPRVVGLIALGTPLLVQERLYTYSYLGNCTKPKLMISGDHDQFAPADNLRRIFALAAEPKEFVLVEDADHFFAGKLPLMRDAISEWLPRLFPAVLSQQRA
ncbi:MAG TPA: alpha/beta fold hydrolase [Terriglobales bacterium]|jgi:alpha/beta superfamily hydrolase|nr:alpha/beta fold hydrolase [Terriglobales bacterium]